MRHLVEDPDLPVDSGPRDPVAVVVEQDALFLGVAPQRRAQLLHLVHRGVQALFVAGLEEGQGERPGEVEGSSDSLTTCRRLLSVPWFQCEHMLARWKMVDTLNVSVCLGVLKEPKSVRVCVWRRMLWASYQWMRACTVPNTAL